MLPDLQLDETQMPWRVNTQENNVAIVNTYTVQPNTSNTRAAPGLEGTSPGDDVDDGDGLDQLSVKFQRSYYVNKSPQKSPKKDSDKSNQVVTPPASTTLSPPIQQSHFLSTREVLGDFVERRLDPDEYEEVRLDEGAIAPQGYTLPPVQHIPQAIHPCQYVRSPVQMAPLQSLHGNYQVQHPQRPMIPMAMYQTLSVASPQVSFPQAVPIEAAQARRLVRQQTQPLPQMAYDENTLMHAQAASQMPQQQLMQQKEKLQTLQTVHTAEQEQRRPASPQRMPKPISRSMPSFPEKRHFPTQLPQVSELDLLSISAPIIPSPSQETQTKIAVIDPQPELEPESGKGTIHLRDISFRDELFESVPETPNGRLAPEGTLWEVDQDPVYDEAALQADVNAWLQNENLAEGSEWLDPVVLN